jgi:hypothetical protein
MADFQTPAPDVVGGSGGSAEDIKAAKRAEILAKLNAAKEAAADAAAKAETQKAIYFGEHPGISCTNKSWLAKGINFLDSVCNVYSVIFR